jgi:hypothetical protein
MRPPPGLYKSGHSYVVATNEKATLTEPERGVRMPPFQQRNVLLRFVVYLLAIDSRSVASLAVPHIFFVGEKS